MSRLSANGRHLALGLLEGGLSIRAVARKMGCFAPTVVNLSSMTSPHCHGQLIRHTLIQSNTCGISQVSVSPDGFLLLLSSAVDCGPTGGMERHPTRQHQMPDKIHAPSLPCCYPRQWWSYSILNTMFTMSNT